MDTFFKHFSGSHFCPGFIEKLHLVFAKFFSKLISKLKIMSLQRRTEAKDPMQGLDDLPDNYGKWK